ncbi:hypothetical protein Pyn_08388 [Prunus yedoensis var. nudiflora]|uniref:Uncharacterized protein n=1 Tax=Prunus yedoensis var. nudiflora TaxID=2094558 RepID=A0A314XPB7_PRUYE|nr:hypothetical protein Pyn_08388 [Prunus yedoensis var. nudiflora]
MVVQRSTVSFLPHPTERGHSCRKVAVRIMVATTKRALLTISVESPFLYRKSSSYSNHVQEPSFADACTATTIL